MSKTSRLTIASLIIAGGWIQAAGAAEEAQGGLERRLEVLRQRFESRTQHSQRARQIRSIASGPQSSLGDIISNNDGFGGTSDQAQIVVARQPDLGTITAWTDDRDGNRSVYGQIYDAAGMPLGDNFRLHADPNLEEQYEVALAVRSDGGFYAAYTRLDHAGDTDVKVERYSRLGQQLGAAVNVATDSMQFLQRKPSIALLANGDLVVLFERDNVGSPNSDIYGQVMAADGLVLLGDPFVVSADLVVSGQTILYDEREPTVAVSGNDTLWTGWTDNRDGGVRDVFAKRFWRDANADTVIDIGAIFKVNDEPIAANAAQNTPKVAAASDGRALFAWADRRNNHWDVFSQSYYASAVAQGGNTLVNTDGSVTDQGQPDVGWADTIGVLVWTDFRSAVGGVWAQRLHLYDSIYVTNGHRERAYDSIFSSSAHLAPIILDSLYRTCDSIYIVQYDADTMTTVDSSIANCSTIVVADTAGLVRTTTVDSFCLFCDSLQVADSSYVLSLGCDTVHVDDTAAVIISETLTKKTGRTGSNFQAAPDPITNQSLSSVGLSPDRTFAVGWQEDVQGQSTVLYRQFDAADVGDTSNTTAEIIISATQIRPACATGAGGNIFALWEEARAALPNIVGQALNVGLTKLGSHQVNDGPDVLHLVPSTSVGDTAGYAVWEDYRDSIQPVYSDIYLQRYTLTPSGYQAVGTNVRVIDTVESQEVRLASWNPAVASDGSGNTMVVWQDNRLNSWDIFAARYVDSINPLNASPVRIGTNVRVDQAPGGTKQILPRIDINPTGQTVVVWEDTRNGPHVFQVWARMYTGAGGTPTGTEVRLPIDASHIPRQPDVAIASDGSFAIVYEDHTDPDDVNIYFQRFTAAGDTLDNNPEYDPILLNDDGLGVQQFSPRITAIANSYVATWQDERDGDWDIYAVQVLDGESIANDNYLVNDADISDQITPAISGLRSSSVPFICWQDVRIVETAPDIFGNTNTPTIATGVGDDVIADGPRPIQFQLGQNAPNPFNPATEISYTLSGPARVELVIYNALGQRVRTLVASTQAAGEHRVVWDGHDDQGRRLASGFYLYRLRWDGGEISRKMTLLR